MRYSCQPTSPKLSSLDCSQPILCPVCMYLGLSQPQWRTLHLALLNFMRFAQTNISGLSMSLWMASLPCSMLTTHTAWCQQLISWGYPQPSVYGTDKDIGQCWSQWQPLRNAINHWSPLGHRDAHHSSFQPIPLSGPSVHMTFQFRDRTSWGAGLNVHVVCPLFHPKSKKTMKSSDQRDTLNYKFKTSINFARQFSAFNCRVISPTRWIKEIHQKEINIFPHSV